MEARWYQEEAVEALMRDLNDAPLIESCGGMVHPLVVAPTGSGKSFMICEFIDEFLSKFPFANILVLSHIQEILEQDFDALEEYFEYVPIGLYSAGLESRIIKKITVAGIHSVYRKPELFEDFQIVIIDECHLVNHKDSGMYREFLGNLDAAYIGFTATHFRLGHGYIHKGEGALFNHISYDISSPDIFNRLVSEGYLARLITKGTIQVLNPDGCKRRGKLGDWIPKSLSGKLDRPAITQMACREIVEFGANYKRWLIFAIDIEHAEHVTKELLSLGVNVECIHSKMGGDRKEIVRRYKRGEIQALVNVEMLTTGLDVPDIDLIAILRPTCSPVLHVQTIGRGLRPHPNKDHCLVLDFAGNIDRLGPINQVKIQEPGMKTKGEGPAPMKQCPECMVHAFPAQKFCEVCGHEFEFRTNLTTSASVSDVVAGKSLPKGPNWYKVTGV
ncbi:hypothetical protein LCGC14_1769750, partial [marine sediment metagenome]